VSGEPPTAELGLLEPAAAARSGASAVGERPELLLAAAFLGGLALAALIKWGRR